MKKHNEGYTLPLVMVVLLVLAIVAVTIMTTSLKNMLRQQQFIEQMQAQYEAQGKIEMIVAKLENLGTETEIIPLDDLNLTKGTDGKPDVLTGTTSAAGSAGENQVTIKCTIQIAATTIVKDGDNSYKITGDPTIAYTSYEIIKGGATE